MAKPRLQSAVFLLFVALWAALAGCASAPTASTATCETDAATGQLRPQSVMERGCFSPITSPYALRAVQNIDSEVRTAQYEAASLVRRADSLLSTRPGAAGNAWNGASQAQIRQTVEQSLAMMDRLAAYSNILLARDSAQTAAQQQQYGANSRYSGRRYGYADRDARSRQRLAETISQNRDLYRALQSRVKALAPRADAPCAAANS